MSQILNQIISEIWPACKSYPDIFLWISSQDLCQSLWKPWCFSSFSSLIWSRRSGKSLQISSSKSPRPWLECLDLGQPWCLNLLQDHLAQCVKLAHSCIYGKFGKGVVSINISMKNLLKTTIIFTVSAALALALQARESFYQIGQFSEPELDKVGSLHLGQSDIWVQSSFKTRRISKGNVFNPDPVLQTELGIDLPNFFFQAEFVQDMANYNQNHGLERWKPQLVEGQVGFRETWLNPVKLVKSVSLDLGYRNSKQRMERKNFNMFQSSNQLFFRARAMTFMNPEIKLCYDIHYGYPYADFSSTSVYPIRIFQKLPMKLVNRSHLYLMGSKFNQKMYGFKQASFTAATNQLYLQIQVSEKIELGPIFQMTRAASSKVRSKWREEKHSSTWNMVFGFRATIQL